MKYEPALDGIRAIAVLAVVVFHVSLSALPGGWAGVDVFFVLSGFLITTILTSEQTTTGGIRLKRFYLRRVLRLAPALFCTCLAAVVIAHWRGGMADHVIWQAVYSLLYIMNWVRAFEGGGYPLGHTWSLAIEEQFYLLWPLFLIAVPARGRLPATAVLAVASLAWRWYLTANGASGNRTYNGFDTHADTLLMGCILGLIYDARRPAAVPAWLGFLSIAGLLVLFRFGNGELAFLQWSGSAIAGALSVVALLAARSEGLFTRLLSWGPVVYTGRISYGLYLWHPVILFAAEPYEAHRGDGLLAIAVSKTLVIGASFAAAALSFRFVEQPFLRLKHRLPAAR